MNYPNLIISDKEKCKLEKIGNELRNIIFEIVLNYSGIKTEVRISGSTQKGTALPEDFFGTDIDLAIMADRKLVEAITYPSNEFEGCQIFSYAFFYFFSSKVSDTYYAGHRISGLFKGVKFDCAIADINKDSWKWDYNDSIYLPKEDNFLIEVKKLKFLTKMFNVSGSEVNGLVGPAAELAIYVNSTADKVFDKISRIPKLNETNKCFLTEQAFPREFFELFGEANDYIMEGLISSFRHTTPNTLNRLIRVAKQRPSSLNEYIHVNKPETILRFNSVYNIRLINLILSIHMKYANETIDILIDENELVILTSISDMEIVTKAINEAKIIEKKGYFDLSETSSSVADYINNTIGNRNLRDYHFFIGMPKNMSNQTPIPFDFLTRPNCRNLINLLEKFYVG